MQFRHVSRVEGAPLNGWYLGGPSRRRRCRIHSCSVRKGTKSSPTSQGQVAEPRSPPMGRCSRAESSKGDAAPQLSRPIRSTRQGMACPIESRASDLHLCIARDATHRLSFRNRKQICRSQSGTPPLGAPTRTVDSLTSTSQPKDSEPKLESLAVSLPTGPKLSRPPASRRKTYAAPALKPRVIVTWRPDDHRAELNAHGVPEVLVLLRVERGETRDPAPGIRTARIFFEHVCRAGKHSVLVIGVGADDRGTTVDGNRRSEEVIEVVAGDPRRLLPPGVAAGIERHRLLRTGTERRWPTVLRPGLGTSTHRQTRQTAYRDWRLRATASALRPTCRRGPFRTRRRRRCCHR